MPSDVNWWDGYNRLDLDGPAFAQWARATVPDMLHEIDRLRKQRDRIRRHLGTCGATTVHGALSHVEDILNSGEGDRG